MDENTQREQRLAKQKEKVKTKKSKKRGRPILYLLLIVILIFAIKVFIDKYMPNFEHKQVRDIFPEWNKSGTVLILKDIPISLSNPPFEKDSEIYLPVDFVKDNMDKYIFWENESKKLTITTENKVIKMKTDELTAYVNNQPLELDIPIKIENNTAYIPATLLESLYYFNITYSKATDIVMVDYKDQPKTTAKLKSKTQVVRSEPNIKAPIIKDLKKGDEVIIYTSDTLDDKWTKIRTNDGIVGYINSKSVENINQIPAVEKEIIQTPESWKPTDGKINLVWDLVTNYDSSVNPSRLIARDGLDVVSPTWFEFADESGNIKNIANKNYIKWAHENGYKVWALFGNKYEGAFNSKMTHDVLTNTEARENMIKQILALASMYELDGINIDFEELASEDGDYFLQFIRELMPFARQQGLTISVDVYVPRPHTQHYKRSELAKIVDYIIVMAYDEHWGTSPESGSVASINWVREGIEDSLDEQIPNEKLIMGIPYYTRLWSEQKQDNGKIKVSSKSYGMDMSKKVLKDNNVEPEWDNETAQYYAEYNKNDITYKMWLEDERSITEKLKLVKEFDLAGIAGWQRMLASESVWDILKQNLK